MKLSKALGNVLLLAFMVGMASCQKEFELSETSVSLNQGDQYTIGYENGTNLVYTSDNPYVASVDDEGVVTAHFVGEATIDVVASEGRQSLRINVVPLHTVYEEPYVDFSMTKSEVMTMYGDSYLGYNDSGMVFFEGKGKYAYGYLFIDGDLQCIYVWCKYTSIDEVLDFLDERYYYVGEEEDFHMHTNWQDMAIGSGEYKGHPNFGFGTMVFYYPIDFSAMAISRGVAMFKSGLEKMLDNSNVDMK